KRRPFITPPPPPRRVSQAFRMPTTRSASTLSRQMMKTTCQNAPVMTRSFRFAFHHDQSRRRRIGMEVIEEAVLARREAIEDDESGYARADHLLFSQFETLELDRACSNIAQLELEPGIGGHDDFSRANLAIFEFDGEDRIACPCGNRCKERKSEQKSSDSAHISSRPSCRCPRRRTRRRP